jgi:hypothetical protein
MFGQRGTVGRVSDWNECIYCKERTLGPPFIVPPKLGNHFGFELRILQHCIQFFRVDLVRHSKYHGLSKEHY